MDFGDTRRYLKGWWNGENREVRVFLVRYRLCPAAHSSLTTWHSVGRSLSKHAPAEMDMSCYEVTKRDEASRRMWHCSWVTKETTVTLGRRIAILRVRCAWNSGIFSCTRNLKSLKKGVSRTMKECIWANTLATVGGATYKWIQHHAVTSLYTLSCRHLPHSWGLWEEIRGVF